MTAQLEPTNQSNIPNSGQIYTQHMAWGAHTSLLSIFKNEVETRLKKLEPGQKQITMPND